MNIFNRFLIIGLVVMITGFVFAGPTFGGGTAARNADQAESVRSVEGIIAIKEGHGDILIRPDTGKDQRMRVESNTTITRNGHPASYNELQVRDRVQARYDAANLKVIEIHATGS